MNASNVNQIAITGLGLLSPLGYSPWQTLRALMAGRTLTDRAQKLPPDIAPVDLVQALGSVGVSVHGSSDPSIDLAERAARQAMEESGCPPHEMDAIVGTSKGAVWALQAAAALHHPSADTSEKQRRGLSGNPSLTTTISPPGDSALAVALGPAGYLGHHLQTRLGVRSTVQVVGACASGLLALHQARQRLMHDPETEKVLVISSDAALMPMFVHSYKRLGVLAKTERDHYRALPLDSARGGFVLAQAGAAVVLERVHAQDAKQKSGGLRLADTAIAAEAFDLIRSDPKMEALQHVARKLLSHRTVDLLHPHAPGTPEHDEAELAVYQRVLGELPPVYACKGALGHSLGAASLTAFVVACLCARANVRPPMPWLGDPVALLRGDTGEMRTLPVRCQAIFAAGFGGHTAGAVIERV